MMFRYFILFIAFLFITAPCATDAQNVAPKTGKSVAVSKIPKLPPVMTTYDIYVGGLHFLTADILFEEMGGKYQTHVHAHTAGYLYKIFKWDGDVLSTGLVKGDHFEPARYRNLDIWRDKPKTTELDFNNKGDIKAAFDPPNTDKNREVVSDEQKRGALDPATALLQMLAHIALDDSCTMKVPVFDGKRRYDLNGEDKGREMVDEADYGVYSGPARVCSVDFDMIAGDWQDRKKNRFWERENGEKGRAAFHIWLASVTEGMPELPVRLESTSPFGDIIAHLSNWHYATSDDLKTESR